MLRREASFRIYRYCLSIVNCQNTLIRHVVVRYDVDYLIDLYPGHLMLKTTARKLLTDITAELLIAQRIPSDAETYGCGQEFCATSPILFKHNHQYADQARRCAWLLT